MSEVGDVIAVAENNTAGVFGLSPETQAVLFFVLQQAENLFLWQSYAGEEISAEDIDIIDRIVGVATYEVMHTMHPQPVGSVLLWFDNNIPSKWLVCNGQAVSRTTYAELYNQWGTQFGNGDGSTTFNLPDMRDRSPMGANLTVGMGDAAGSATHTLTTAEMPVHNHRERVGNGASAFQLVGGGGANPTVANGVTTSTTVMNTGDTGGGSAHNNLHPVRGCHFIVYVGVET